jgi:hypothetical protein
MVQRSKEENYKEYKESRLIHGHDHKIFVIVEKDKLHVGRSSLEVPLLNHGASFRPKANGSFNAIQLLSQVHFSENMENRRVEKPPKPYEGSRWDYLDFG